MTDPGQRRFVPIAITGFSGVFPGVGDDQEAFRRMLREGRTAAAPVPDSRWTLPPDEACGHGGASSASGTVGAPDVAAGRVACLLPAMDYEADGFAPEVAALLPGLDPVLRLSLHAGARAWRGSATSANVDRARTGVVLAAIALPTEAAAALTDRIDGVTPDTGPITTADGWNARVVGAPAAIVAAGLGLGGGAFTLDAACASSLYALRFACDELAEGRADAMLAGGVSRPDSLYTQMGFSQLRALSPSGRCAPFGDSADGLVVGEGAGVAVLRRLDDAVAAGEPVLAVIRGIGLSNDTAGSLLSPDSEGQSRAMAQAYAMAGWRPADVDFVECHGTGTPTGDAVEIASLAELFAGDGATRKVPVGSVKSNVGHLLTAAGMAALAKTLGAMAEGVIPPTANVSAPAPALAGTALSLPLEAMPWPRRMVANSEGKGTGEGSDGTVPRRAAVSGFGFGGINAHFLLEEWIPGAAADSAAEAGRNRLSADAAADAADDPVAIVGMAVRVGPVRDLRAFQELVFRGDTAVGPRPADRWSSEPAGPGADALSAARGAWMPAVEVEVGRFKIPPAEIDRVLPRQLLALMVTDDALADAAGPNQTHRVSGPSPRTGVYFGAAYDHRSSDFHRRWRIGTADHPATADLAAARDAVSPALDAPRVVGALGNMVASRVAKEFGFGGPSFELSSGPSSGLRALSLAAGALRRGEIDSALVGAVDLCGDARAMAARAALRPLSPGGAARPFDADAGGAVTGEGAAALVVKRLSDARRDGDRVYAVLRGHAHATGDLADAGEALTRAMRAAIAMAGGRAPGYLECHGSGAPADDSAEAGAIGSLAGGTSAGGAAEHPMAIGSVAPSVGSVGAAGGLVSLVKAALCLHVEMLPPLTGFAASHLGCERDPDGIFAPRFAQYWFRDRADGPRRAGVSSIGTDGTAAFAVLEGDDDSAVHARRHDVAAERAQPLGARDVAVFAARGADAAGVAAELRRLAGFARASDRATAGIEAMARDWHRDAGPESAGRSELCAAVVARDARGLARSADAAAGSVSSSPASALAGQGGVWFSPAPLGAPADGGAVAFVFPGSGNHYLGMGRGISAWWPEVLRKLDAENLHLASQTMARWYLPQRRDWRAGWEADAARAIADDPQRMIFGQVAYGTVVSDLLRSLGVEPSAVIGYSLGESTGLFALRAWRDRDGMLQRMLASPLFRTELAGPCHAAARAWGLLEEGEGGGGTVAVDWRVAVVNRPSADVRRAVADAAAAGVRRVYHLIANTPDECVIGGDAAEVRALIRALGCDAFVIEGVPTVHCDVVREVEYAYQELHRLETTPPAGVRFYSVAKARAHHLTREAAAGSILAQAQKGFDFPATIERAYDDGVRVFVEPGPQGSCTRMIGKILAGRPHVAVSACLAGEDDNATIAKLMAAMLAERVVADLAGLYGRDTLCVGHRTARAAGARTKAVVVVPLDTRRARPPKRTEVEPPRPMPEAVPDPVVSRDDPAPYPSSTARPKAQPAVVPAFASPSSEAWRGDVHVNTGGTDGGLFATVAVTAAADIAAHDSYLAFASSALADFGSGLALQARLIELNGHAAGGATLMERSPVTEARFATAPATPAVPVAFTREQCLKFARGSLAEVFGPAFAAADAQPTRTRLPEPPLMLCDRVLTITGEPGSMSRGTVVTEHDVLPGAWYLDGGRAPVCISVEAGQADMFLASWLGVDLHTAGLRMYRLLDARVTFHRDLPPAGSTLRYEIALDRFVTQGDTHLFFFRFEGFVDGEPLLTMTDGTAGYFTHEEVENSGGILDARIGPGPVVARPVSAVAPFTAMADGESLDAGRLSALRSGDLSGAFGSAFAGLPLADPVRLPGGPMTLVHRIDAIHPAGGRAGLGFIRGEADIRPDDWFLTCHFFDDMVMPGTLMFECCAHVLRVFLMRMGWVGEQASDARTGGCAWQPVAGAGARLKCRGPVTPQTRLVTYEIEVTELGFGPEPYAIADALMLADGRPVVKIDGMSLRLTGQSPEGLAELWAGRTAKSAPAAAAVTPTAPAIAPETVPAVVPLGGGVVASARKPALFGPDRILAYSNGLPSEAFGEPYRPFDTDRRIARLPGPPYQFLDRVTDIRTAPWELAAGGWIECQWDVPADAWHFRANRQRAMSFAILLEAALQPCGWMAAYVGSALRGAEDLSFRNLGGTATLFIEPTSDIGTLTTRTRLDKVSEAGGMIIQEFSIQVWSGSRIVYNGMTSFGFFTAAALATQVGVRDAAKRRYSPDAAETARAVPAVIADAAPRWPDDPATDVGPPSAPPARALRMVDDVELFVPDGGPRGLGYLRGTKGVDAGEWFFAAHFYQDPVVPGSLGLEAFLQLMKVAALHRWPGLAGTHRFEPIALGVPHTWVYRGQVIPRNRMVTVEVSITAVDNTGHLLMADGFLVVDGLPIYEMKDFGLRMVAA